MFDGLDTITRMDLMWTLYGSLAVLVAGFGLGLWRIWWDSRIPRIERIPVSGQWIDRPGVGRVWGIKE